MAWRMRVRTKVRRKIRRMKVPSCQVMEENSFVAGLAVGLVVSVENLLDGMGARWGWRVVLFLDVRLSRFE